MSDIYELLEVRWVQLGCVAATALPVLGLLARVAWRLRKVRRLLPKRKTEEERIAARRAKEARELERARAKDRPKGRRSGGKGEPELAQIRLDPPRRFGGYPPVGLGRERHDNPPDSCDRGTTDCRRHGNIERFAGYGVPGRALTPCRWAFNSDQCTGRKPAPGPRGRRLSPQERKDAHDQIDQALGRKTGSSGNCVNCGASLGRPSPRGRCNACANAAVSLKASQRIGGDPATSIRFSDGQGLQGFASGGIVPLPAPAWAEPPEAIVPLPGRRTIQIAQSATSNTNPMTHVRGVPLCVGCQAEIKGKVWRRRDDPTLSFCSGFCANRSGRRHPGRDGATLDDYSRRFEDALTAAIAREGVDVGVRDQRAVLSPQGLDGFTRRLIAPTDKATEAARKLGIEMVKTNGVVEEWAWIWRELGGEDPEGLEPMEPPRPLDPPEYTYR